MIEKIVNDYLNDSLDVAAYLEKPEDPPERYVLIEKTGSGEDNYLSSAVMAIQSYAPSLYEACAINDSVKRAMAHLSEVTSVTKVKLNTDYNFTDTSKAQYRYQAVFDLFYYDE